MARRTMVLRRNGVLRHPRDAQGLLERLAAQPGVESVRVEVTPLCVVLQLAEQADELALRAIVQQQRVEVEGREVVRMRPASVPPGAMLRAATSAPPPR